MEGEDHQPKLVTVGSAVVDRMYDVTNIPVPDTGAYVLDHDESIGGVEANVAVGVRRLGHPTGVIARVGNDEYADYVIEDLKKNGVDTRHVKRERGEGTSYCMIFRNERGQRTIVAGGESVPRLRIRDEDIEYLERAEAVFTSAYIPDPTVSRLVEMRDNDRISEFVFDLSGVIEEIEGRGVYRTTISSALEASDLLITNQVAAKSYLGEKQTDDLAGDLFSHGADMGAVTKGREGAVLFDGNETVEVPAFDVDTVDTTGAGDAFTSGLIHSLVLEDRDLYEAGVFASACGALNCGTETAHDSMPTKEEVESFLESRG